MEDAVVEIIGVPGIVVGFIDGDIAMLRLAFGALQFSRQRASRKRADFGESLPPPFKLWELQEALHAKAKGNPSYLFYALYDKLCRADVLAEAWRRCLANGVVAGSMESASKELKPME